MLKLQFIRKTHYLGVEDTRAIETIKARHGLSTDSDAVRFALRLLAESPVVQIAAKKKSSGKV